MKKKSLDFSIDTKRLIITLDKMGCTIIKESDIGSIEYFGKYDRIINSGCHCYIPCIERVAYVKSLRVFSEKVALETVTKESLSVTIKVGINYKINSEEIVSDRIIVSDDDIQLDSFNEKTKLFPNKVSYQNNLPQSKSGSKSGFNSGSEPRKNAIYLAMYSTSDPLSMMKQHISTYFRAISCNYTMNELFLSKNKLSGELQHLLNREMEKYGYLIVDTMILDIDPPSKVKETMNMVLASQNRRDAMINEAEAEKKSAILKAEGLCEVRRLEGLGLANQRKEVVQGLKNSIGELCDGKQLDPTELTTTIITMQYLDMLKEAAYNGKNTFILSSNPATASTIEDQMRNAILSAR